VVPIPDGFLSRKQVAELFRVDPQTLSHWVRAGKLEGSLHDGRWVFDAGTIRTLLGGDRPVLEWRAVADLPSAGPGQEGVDPRARSGDPFPGMPLQSVHALRPDDETTVCGRPVPATATFLPPFVKVTIVLRCPVCDEAATLERHTPDSRNGSP
jgi:hypothetical protein